MSSVSEYANIASNMASIAQILGGLAEKFAAVEARNAVDDAMIDALGDRAQVDRLRSTVIAAR